MHNGRMRNILKGASVVALIAVIGLVCAPSAQAAAEVKNPNQAGAKAAVADAEAQLEKARYYLEKAEANCPDCAKLARKAIGKGEGFLANSKKALKSGQWSAARKFSQKVFAYTKVTFVAANCDIKGVSRLLDDIAKGKKISDTKPSGGPGFIDSEKELEEDDVTPS